MASLTTRFSLVLPDPAEQVEVSSQINANTLAIDNALGFLPCTSVTRPSSPGPGQAIYETDTKRRYLWDTSGAVGAWVLIGDMGGVVESNLVVTNTVTTEGVDEWALPMSRDTTYAVDITLGYQAAADADAQLVLTPPSGSTMLLLSSNLSTAASAGSAPSLQVSTTGTLTFGGLGVGVSAAARITGTITTGTTDGALLAGWAQATAQASNATLLAGSLLVLRRV
jgi:hypothetical protein